MKKRSLVAALAMLIVSAITLTSSTYAWFSTSTKANVTGISANINSAAGSIQISADNTNWKTSLTQSDFNADTNTITSTYVPVSFEANATNAATAPNIVRGTIGAGGKFENETLGKDYTKLTMWVKSSDAAELTISGSFATSTYNFFYAAVYIGGESAVYTNVPDGRSYTPLTNASGAIDGNGNGVIENGEGGTLAANEVAAVYADGSAAAPENTIKVNLPAGTATELTLYVWAEGNDAACIANEVLTQGTVSFGLNFSIPEPEVA